VNVEKEPEHAEMVSVQVTGVAAHLAMASVHFETGPVHFAIVSVHAALATAIRRWRSDMTHG
jgi:hypothetical protein